MDCPKCESDRLTDIDCDACDGHGRVLDCDIIVDCDMCNGTGYEYIHCLNCGYENEQP